MGEEVGETLAVGAANPHAGPGQRLAVVGDEVAVRVDR